MDNTPPSIQPQPITDTPQGKPSKGTRRPSKMRYIIVIIGAVVLALALVVAAYYQALRPVDSTNEARETVEIVSGMTPTEIGAHLKEKDLIRNELAFSLYTRIQGVRHQLQAGTYELQRTQSTQDITSALIGGPEMEEIEVTFLPGATLIEGKKVLSDLGFKEADIDRAFTAHYDHPLFAGRPASAGIEGYLYGETHRFASTASLESILMQYFDDFYTAIEQNDLIGAYEGHGMTLYEGITLASIIQKEVSGEGDSRQVSQVFHKRLDEGISLGADATFVYAAQKNGDTPRINYPSPYNTRLHGGLPPGPIATPGVEALRAAAYPAEGDYLFFVSGDDGKNYFSRTEAEHIDNTRRYCVENCTLF